MKILIIGYGSMGKRRHRLTRELLPDASFFCVESNPIRMAEANKEGAMGFENLEDGISERPDIAFVCTSPGSHADIIMPLVNRGINVFTELNLTSERYDEIMAEAMSQGAIVFMSSTMLYKRQVEVINEMVTKQKKPLVYQYHVGQYLPDWHPWESYKEYFVGRKETNGVREILAIQLPWIVSTFGEIKQIDSARVSCTDLEIEYPDCAVLTIHHANGNVGTFVSDVVSRKSTTKIEIIGEDIHVTWDGHNDDLYKYNFESEQMEQIVLDNKEEHIAGYSDVISERPYREEIREFLGVVRGLTRPRYSLEQDKQVLSWIEKIESR